MINTAEYRWAVQRQIGKKDIALTDVILSNQTIEQIKKTFKDCINGNDLLLYGSAVTRTNSRNGRYYNDMDTAYKFYQTTALGSLGNNWQSTSLITGSTPISSFVNYYDNTYKFTAAVKSKKIFVRHIDITGLVDVKSENLDSRVIDSLEASINNNSLNGNAIEISISNNGNNIFEGTIDKSIIETQDEDFALGKTYTDYYKFNGINNTSIVIPNIKYVSTDYVDADNNDITVSYLQGTNLTNKEKDILNNYQCLGFVQGEGNTLEQATLDKNKVIDAIKNISAELTNGGDYSSAVISANNENDYIVIDFFYVKPTTTKNIYVRHIDLTGYNGGVTKANVDRAITDRSTLSGYGKALLKGTSEWIPKSLITMSDYQEVYRATQNNQLTVYSSLYGLSGASSHRCIGSNIVSSNTNLADAKAKMDDILKSKAYNSSRTTSVDAPSDKYVTIIDFYYTKNSTSNYNEADTLKRPQIGRLSFYTLDSQTTPNPQTLSGDNSTSGNINNKVSNNNKVVYDVVPSGETLKASVDNAYLYMLGGINIQEKKTTGSHNLSYTINQPYTVYYKDWSSACDSCSWSSNGKVDRACRNSWRGEDKKTEYCDGLVSSSFEWKSTTGSASKVFKYNIPFNYTYYKIKNMRLYTIDKIELLDGYNNAGLPLFDGKTHVINTTQAYKDMFRADNVFEDSYHIEELIDKDGNARASTELDKLELYYYNESGDISESTATNASNDILTSLMHNKIGNHTIAATITGFQTGKESSYTKNSAQVTLNTDGFVLTNNDDPLVARLTVTNDKVELTDPVTKESIYIVGKDDSDLRTINLTDTENNFIISKKKNEYKSVVNVNLANYTSGISRDSSNNNYTYTFNSSQKAEKTINTTTNYPSSIRGTSANGVGSQYLPSSNLTTKGYFEERALNIPVSRLNGKRYSFGRIYYSLLTDNDKLNFDVNSTSPDYTWTRTTVNGSGTTTFKDTEMYNTTGSYNTNQKSKITISPNMLGNIVWEYGKNNKNSKDVDIVNVFTPIAFRTRISDIEAEEEYYVNHTESIENVGTDQIIQKNARFTIEMNTEGSSYYTSLNTTKYLKSYYIKFDFDVQDIKIFDAQSPTGRNYSAGSVEAGNWIGPIYNLYGSNKAENGQVKISAYALQDANDASSVVNQESNTYWVRAVANNTPTNLISDLQLGKINASDTENYSKIVTGGENEFTGNDSTNQYHQKYYSQTDIIGQHNYIAENTVTTDNYDRVYDFKVTDLKDIDWKNIFRKTTATTTNAHTSKAYYSGVNKWNIYTTKVSEMLIRDVSEIGATRQQILPLGPHKNLTATYTKAPKLGYRFSFDLKTTGAKTYKKIVITPEFYYISKNGSRYIDSKHIKLFYKNSNNKYVDIKNYNIYFVPDDGYRLTFEGTDKEYRFSGSTLSKSTVKLGTASEITLDKRMMQTADNMFVQIWYGEYKLPNSTIAVELNNSGKYDINKPLTDGYIGVKFNIRVNEYTDSNMNTLHKVLSYSQNNRNYYGGTNHNTSQWDYEGYLGFTALGNKVTASNALRISLEKGTWIINDQAKYDAVKGTVILYDIDAKASSDYD